MTDPGESKILSDTGHQDKVVHDGRFERFSDAELSILSDALRELWQVKIEALQIANADLGVNPEHPFTEYDLASQQSNECCVSLKPGAARSALPALCIHLPKLRRSHQCHCLNT